MPKSAILVTSVLVLCSGSLTADTKIFVATPNSVAATLDSLTPGPSNRYTVHLGPGTFTETNLVKVPAYVTLKGSGENVTIIESTRNSASIGPAAATVEIDCATNASQLPDETECGHVSHVQIRNEATTGTFAIGVYSAEDSEFAVLDHSLVVVSAETTASGVGVYLNDSEMTIRSSRLRATSPSTNVPTVLAALAIVNGAGGIPIGRIENSILEAGVRVDLEEGGDLCAGNSGVGTGLQTTNASPQFFDSQVCGDDRGVFMSGTVGQCMEFHHSQIRVGSGGDPYLFELSGSRCVRIFNSGLSHFTGDLLAPGSVGSLNCLFTAYTPTFSATDASCAVP